jgi:hypothetical protein
LRFDARRWLLSKALPKMYGDAPPTLNDNRTQVIVGADAVQALAALRSSADGRAAIGAGLREMMALPEPPPMNGHTNGNGHAHGNGHLRS